MMIIIVIKRVTTLPVVPQSELELKTHMYIYI